MVDLATRTVMRVRVPWPEGHDPDISTFDVVEVTLADDPERDDLAQPEATTVADLPRHVGTLRGRHLRKLLRRLVAVARRPAARLPRALRSLLGVPGLPAVGGADRAHAAAPAHPTPGRRDHLGPLRLGPRRRLAPRRGPQRGPRPRRGAARAAEWEEPLHRAGVRAPVPPGDGQPPRDGHCYKVCAAVLPRADSGPPAAAGSAAELAAARSSAMAQPKATRRSPRSALKPLEVRLDPVGDLDLGGDEVRPPATEPSPLRTKVRSSSRLSQPKRLDRRRAQARSSPEDLWPGNGHDVLQAVKAGIPRARQEGTTAARPRRGRRAGPGGTGPP